jgi:hypothetical protein
MLKLDSSDDPLLASTVILIVSNVLLLVIDIS